jgi:hypothetical protein
MMVTYTPEQLKKIGPALKKLSPASKEDVERLEAKLDRILELLDFLREPEWGDEDEI